MFTLEHNLDKSAKLQAGVHKMIGCKLFDVLIIQINGLLAKVYNVFSSTLMQLHKSENGRDCALSVLKTVYSTSGVMLTTCQLGKLPHLRKKFASDKR